MTKPLLTGLPVLSVSFQSCVTPRSHSYAMAILETQFFLNESCAYRKVHLSSVVEQFDSSDVPTASQSLAWTAVRLFSEQESSQHRKATTSLGWAITMCAGPPATLDCKKRSKSRLADSRRRVDGFPATVFVNWANGCSMAYSSMHSRAVSLSLEPYVLGAAHHWRKGNASSFSPGHFEHRTLLQVSDTRISVLGGVFVTGIPQTKRDSTAPRIGRMERISRSRFRRACRMGYVCGGGEGVWREVGAVPSDERKRCHRVRIGRFDRSRYALRVLIRR